MTKEKRVETEKKIRALLDWMEENLTYTDLDENTSLKDLEGALISARRTLV